MCVCVCGGGGEVIMTIHIILHFLRACSIVWPVQPVPTLQKTGEGDWIHSRIRNSPSSEQLPACYSIGPLQER